jgi:hypothetical protein
LETTGVVVGGCCGETFEFIDFASQAQIRKRKIVDIKERIVGESIGIKSFKLLTVRYLTDNFLDFI